MTVRGKFPRPGESGLILGAANVAAAAEYAGRATLTLSATAYAEGVVDTGSQAVDAWEYVKGLTIPELLVLFAWVREQVITALQDPETALIGTLASLPMLALVIRALRDKSS